MDHAHAPSPRNAALAATLAVCLAPTAAQAAVDASLDSGSLLINLILVGLALFILLRVLSGRGRKNNPDQSDQPGRPPRSDDPDAAPPLDPRPSGKPDMYTNAQAAWNYLRSPDKAKPAPAPDGSAAQGVPATPPAPVGTDEEFLAGAKLAYSRIAAALGSRDFTDLGHFVSPAYLAELKNSLPGAPAGKPDILLVSASLAERRDAPDTTVMVVDYDVLARQPGAPENAQLRERWTFSRDNATPGANWLLTAMERR
jgi:predicted lipid-binding transport protein (Tim44 family)